MRRFVPIPLLVLVTTLAGGAAADVRAAYSSAFLERMDHSALPARHFPPTTSVHLEGNPETPAAALGAAMSVLLGADAHYAAECLARLELDDGEPCSAGTAGCVVHDEGRAVERGALVEVRAPHGAAPVTFRSPFDDASEVRTFFETVEYLDLTHKSVRQELIACLDERLPVGVQEFVVPKTLYLTRATTFISKKKNLNVDSAPQGHAPIASAAARWSSRFEARARSEPAWRIVDRPPPIRRSLIASLAPYLRNAIAIDDLPGRSWEWTGPAPAAIADLNDIELRRAGVRVASCKHACPGENPGENKGTCGGLRTLTCDKVIVPAAAEPAGRLWSIHAMSKEGTALEWLQLPIRITPLQARVESCTVAKSATGGNEQRLTCLVAWGPSPTKPITLRVFDARAGGIGAPLATWKAFPPGERSTLSTNVALPAALPPGMRDVIVTLSIDDAVHHSHRFAMGAGQ